MWIKVISGCDPHLINLNNVTHIYPRGEKSCVFEFSDDSFCLQVEFSRIEEIIAYHYSSKKSEQERWLNGED